MNKKLLVMMSAMVMCFSALPLQSVHAETDDNIVNPDCAETYVDVMPKIPVDVQYILPEWIPQNFTEAMQFDNKYGKTHIEDGLICCVRKKYNRIDCNEYLTEYSGESANECEPLVMFNETYNFVMPEKPDESDKEAYQEYLDFIHENYISKYIEYAEYYGHEVDIKADFEYEVTVYAMNPSSSVDINWIEKNQQTDRIVSTTTLSFESSADGVITETDLYGWFPDALGECYIEPVSIVNGHIVFCDYICYDGGYSLITEQDGTAKLECVASSSLYGTTIMPSPPGTSPIVIRAYKPVTSGTVKVTFKEAREWEQDGEEASKTVKCYNVDEDGNITEIDESEVTLLNMGDCNLDDKFTVSDVVMLQKWLVGSGELKCWQNADFNNDNRVDVFDLLLMKKALTEKLPLVSQKSEEVTNDDITMLKQTVLMKYPDTDMSNFTFVYEPDHQLNHHFNGKLFSVYYKGVLLHGYGDINTDENVYAVIKKEKNNYKSVEMNFIVDPERFKEVNLDGEYKSAEEIKESINKYEMETAEKGPQFIIYVDWISGFNYELKPAYLVKWHDYECIYDAVTGEEIEYIPYYVV